MGARSKRPILGGVMPENRMPAPVERHFGADAVAFGTGWRLAVSDPWSRAEEVSGWWQSFADAGWTVFAGIIGDDSGLFAVPACEAADVARLVRVGSHNAGGAADQNVARVATFLTSVAERLTVRVLCVDAAGLLAELDGDLDRQAAQELGERIVRVCPEAISAMMSELEDAGINVEGLVFDELERLEDEGISVDELEPAARPDAVNLCFDAYLRSLGRLRLWWD